MPPIPVLELLVSTRRGGGPRHVHDLARGLRTRGFDPIVAGPRDGPLFDAFVDAGIETFEVATDRLSPGTCRQLMKVIRARGVRLVHSHGKGAGVHGRLTAWLSGIPAVHTFHGIHFERYPAAGRVAYLALERWLARRTRTVINVSRAQEEEGLALRLFSAAQSRVVHNGVDIAALGAAALDRVSARHALGSPGGGPMIGCAARLDPVKGLDALLRAVGMLPDRSLQVVLIGAGEERDGLHGLARTLGIGDRVRFVGEMPEAARVFRAFDLYVSSSRKEGLPMALLEALALGIPTLATDIPAHREVLGPEWPGLCPLDPGGMSAILARHLADPSLTAQLGALGRRRAQGFAVNRMVDETARLYGEALAV